MRRQNSRTNNRIDPRALLATRWRHFNSEDLELHLRLLILAEHRSQPMHPHYDPTMPTYRLRARRKLVARRFVAFGGQVSRCLLTGPLPTFRKWPGLVHLVKTNDFELLGGAADAVVA